MKRSLSLALVVLLVGSGPLKAAPSAEPSYRVVVNQANPIALLTKDQVSKIFLKKIPKWDSGQPILPVDQEATSPVRTLFSKDVHGKAASAVASYWQQQIFAGRDVPPTEKGSDAAVIAFVRANPSAIGYVSEAASVGDVKVVAVQ
jgi:ABC-type phosphate transport system substrate-binding protein